MIHIIIRDSYSTVSLLLAIEPHNSFTLLSRVCMVISLSINCHPYDLQVYRPGKTISGAVEFTLTEPKRYDCIKVNFFGSAHVQWKSGKTRFIGNEKYVDQSLLLWSPQQSSTGLLGPGSFSFRFQFVIPSHVPSSFNYQNPSIFSNSHAHVSYNLKARAVTGTFRFDHKASVPIFIMRLTSISCGNQTKPIRQVKRKQVGCLCYAAGNVEFVAKLPRTGFCVTNGDVIPLTVDVENNCTRNIQMRARIMKCVSMFVRGNENRSKEVMAEITSEPIQPRSSYVWNPTNWIVPALMPTLLGSRIIHADYVLEVAAVIPYAINLSCDISLLMGNLPYNSNAGNLERALLGAIVTAMVRSRNLAATHGRGAQDQSHGGQNHGADINGKENEDEYNSSERNTQI